MGGWLSSNEKQITPQADNNTMVPPFKLKAIPTAVRAFGRPSNEKKALNAASTLVQAAMAPSVVAQRAPAAARWKSEFVGEPLRGPSALASMPRLAQLETSVRARHVRLESGLQKLVALQDAGQLHEATAVIRDIEAASRELDTSRSELLSAAANHPERGAGLRRRFGVPNPEMRTAPPLSGQRLVAAIDFFGRFQNFTRGGVLATVPARLVARGVTGVSPRILLAGSELLRSAHGSFDRTGSANVQHVGSVFRSVLEAVQLDVKRPLTQREVDLAFLQTWSTDGRGKVPEPGLISDAMTIFGKPVSDVMTKMRSNIRAEIDGELQVGRFCLEVRERLLAEYDGEKFKMPLPAHFDAEYRRGREHVVLSNGRDLAANQHLAHVWAHGALMPEKLTAMLKSAGLNANERGVVLEGYYGHHPSHFPAMLLGAGRLATPDFGLLVSLGLPKPAANRLSTLWATSTALNTSWGPRVLQIAERPLTAAEFNDLLRDAAPLRAAVAALPREVRHQLLQDDVGQFTFDGMPKWSQTISLRPNANGIAPTTTGDLAKALAEETIAGYMIFNLARAYGSRAQIKEALNAKDPSTQHPFVEQTKRVELALGFTFDSHLLRMRQLTLADPQFTARGRAILADPRLLAEYNAVQGEVSDAAAVNRWFDARPADTFAIDRLARVVEPFFE